MASVGFFGRLGNLFRGFLSLFIKGLENKNPEYVYEAAIEQQKERYQELRSAAAGILMLTKKLGTELEERSNQLREVTAQVMTAVEQGDDEAALVLIQRKDELAAEVERLKKEYEKSQGDYERTKIALQRFQAEIEKLKREKETMLARRADAQARLAVERQLDGLSVESDMRALNNVREEINRQIAEADMAVEVQQSDLQQRLDRIKQQAASTSAQVQLEQLKKEAAARRQAQQQGEGSAPGAGPKSL